MKANNRPALGSAGHMAVYSVILVLAIVAGMSVERSLLRREVTTQRSELSQEAFVLSAELQRQLVAKELMVRGVAGYLAANPDPTPQQYTQMAAHLSSDFPHVLNIAAAPDLVVRYVYPRERNASVIGFDYRQTHEQLAGVAAAIRSRGVEVQGPVELVQGGYGFILRAAMYERDVDGAETDSLWGIISVVVDAAGLMDSAGFTEAAETRQIAVRRVAEQGQVGATFYGDSALFDRDPVLLTVALPSGSWQIAMLPVEGWAVVSTYLVPSWLIILVLALTGFGVTHHLLRLRDERDATRRRLVQAIEAMNDGFSLYDADDRLVMCNTKYREMFGSSAKYMVPGVSFESIVRRSVANGLYPEAKGSEEAWIQRRLDLHRADRSESEQLLRDGRWLKVTESRAPDGSIVGFRVDVTALKRAQQAAEEANRAKTDFLNNVSHELRTPLTVVLGYNAFVTGLDKLPDYRRLCDILEDDGAPPRERRRHLDALADRIRHFSRHMDTSGKHLLSLINSVLDWSKIEAGELRLDREPVQAAQVVEEVADQLRPLAEGKGLTLTVEPGAAVIDADPLRVRQVLINLVGNAVKFTDQGTVTVGSRLHDGMAEFYIDDTGCGVAQENLERIFERFKQVDSSPTRTHAGTGLGLAIVKHIVRLHDGAISVSSTPGEGSHFAFRIPLAVADDIAAGASGGATDSLGDERRSA